MAFDLSIVPITLFILALAAVGATLVVLGTLAGPRRPNPVKGMPYESGVDPFHDARRRLTIRYHLLAVAFLVFDVELLFLYPWAVALRETPRVSAVRETSAAVTAVQEASSAVTAVRETSVAVTSDVPPSTASLPRMTPASSLEPHDPRATVRYSESDSNRYSESDAKAVSGAARTLIFWGGLVFLTILTLGYVYDWRKGVFRY